MAHLYLNIVRTSVTYASSGLLLHTYNWILSGRPIHTHPRWVIGPEKHLVLNIVIAHLYLNIVRTSVTYASGGSGDRRYTTNLEIREMVYTDTGIL